VHKVLSSSQDLIVTLREPLDKIRSEVDLLAVLMEATPVQVRILATTTDARLQPLCANSIHDMIHY